MEDYKGGGVHNFNWPNKEIPILFSLPTLTLNSDFILLRQKNRKLQMRSNSFCLIPFDTF
jgi:hypothetical protein